MKFVSKDKLASVLIAGIGGASLGTELAKCLAVTEKYKVYGCDISRYAYGHYMPGFEKTFRVRQKSYIEDILCICREHDIDVVVPGGEEPLRLLDAQRARLQGEGVVLAANSSKVIETFIDKDATFRRLAEIGVPVPMTREVTKGSDLDDFPYPCIIKPASGSGGSEGVAVVKDKREAELYWLNGCQLGRRMIIQEYIPHNEGEFSLGVLSLPGHGVVGSIALKKVFKNKLSIHARFDGAVISSPYSSGIISDYDGLRNTVESMVEALGSEGPMNVQGRMRNGIFYPYEINPRFSGSEYVRTMAGFNQLHLFIAHALYQRVPEPIRILKGYYARSLDETYAPLGEIVE